MQYKGLCVCVFSAVSVFICYLLVFSLSVYFTLSGIYDVVNICFLAVLFSSPAFAMMGLCSVTWESVKVRKQNDESDEKNSFLNNSFILLPCLSFLSVIISEWSEWTPCSPCVPSSSLQHNTSQTGVISGTKMVSIQRRFRACLDLDSGLPVSREEEESQCPGQLLEERLCPDANICRGNDVCLRGQKEVHSYLSPKMKRSQFLSLPSSSSSSLFNSTVRESNEWGSLAPSQFHSAWCNNMTLCSQQKISCRQRSELVRASRAWHLRKNWITDWVRMTVTVTGDEITPAWLSL